MSESILSELAKQSFLSCVSSGKGGGRVEIGFTKLEDAQALHRQLLSLANDPPMLLSDIETLKTKANEKGVQLHDILFRRAGWAIMWFEEPRAGEEVVNAMRSGTPVGDQWRKGLVVYTYYPSLAEAVKAETLRVEALPGAVLTVSEIENGFFNAGEKFEHRDGRRVIAVHKPGYFEGEDGDSLLVQYEGVDYGGHFFDEAQASNLRRVEGTT